MKFKSLKLFSAMLSVIFSTGCVTKAPYDYSAYKQHHPKSILVLPPLNQSPDVQATYSFFSHVTQPLAESGYYIFPVALVDETFKQNGLTHPADIHATTPEKLQEIFGADAALYITIAEYGSVYRVLSSAAVVTAKARLIDLKTKQLLWEGVATASSDEGQNNSGGIAALLVGAIVKQILNNVTDASHRIAGVTSNRLLLAGQSHGLLYGHRSPNYGKDKQAN